MAKWTSSKQKALQILNGLSVRLNSGWCPILPHGFILRYEYGWALELLYTLALWVTPVPWLIIARYGEVLESVDPWEARGYSKMYIDDIITDALDGFPELQISSFEPLTRQEANNILRFWDGMLSFDPDAEKTAS
jgi:hypothetical protein